MKSSKDERRKMRKAELEALSISELKKIKPYQEEKVAPVKNKGKADKSISKEAMIETILSTEGLG